MKKALILLSVMIVSNSVTYAGKCTGKSDCSACKNCKNCQHCKKEGGKCGACKPSTKK